MGLHPEIRLALDIAAEETAETAAQIHSLRESVNKLIEDMESGEVASDGVVAEEAFDDPSVVRHASELARAGERARRASDRPATLPYMRVTRHGTRR